MMADGLSDSLDNCTVHVFFANMVKTFSLGREGQGDRVVKVLDL